MYTEFVTVKNRLGLHTRVCSQLVACASRYESRVTLTYQGRCVDAKRIVELMSLGAAFGALVRICVEGPDEKMAFYSIFDLFNQGFGEVS